MADTITKIYPSDLISDSMVKINRNFDIILNRDDVTESKLNQWTENIENKLADIRNENGIISNTLLNNVQTLENRINNIINLDGITKEVQNIINNASVEVENLINDKAGEAISLRLSDYVKTSTLNGILKSFKTPIERIEIFGEYNIDGSDHHTIVTTTSDITLKTSDSPEKGTEYDIYVCNYDVTLNLNGKSALNLANGVMTEYDVDTIITLKKNTYYHIIFDGTCWFINQ